MCPNLNFFSFYRYPDSMHICSKFNFLWILSRHDKFVMSNLWQNSCKANGIISDHSLAKQVCSKTVAILSESAWITMVTSALALTCCKLVMNLQTCHAELAELAASLQTCNATFAASLLQVKIAIWELVLTIDYELHNFFRCLRIHSLNKLG